MRSDDDRPCGMTDEYSRAKEDIAGVVGKGRLGAQIASGNEAEIYQWHPVDDSGAVEQVIKLFFGSSPEHAKAVVEIGRTIDAMGVAAPAVIGDVIEIDGRFGVVFERVQGIDMTSRMQARPWTLPAVGPRLGELHARLHEERPKGLIPLREMLAFQISHAKELTAGEQKKIQQMLEKMPDGDRLLHCDFHPGNVICSDDATNSIIDWSGAAVGDPMADVARSWLLMTTSFRGAPRWIDRALGGIALPLVHLGYAKRYFEITGADPAEAERWRIVIAAARLNDDVADIKPMARLVRQLLAGLS